MKRDKAVIFSRPDAFVTTEHIPGFVGFIYMSLVKPNLSEVAGVVKKIKTISASAHVCVFIYLRVTD